VFAGGQLTRKRSLVANQQEFWLVARRVSEGRSQQLVARRVSEEKIALPR
jgi:hypothetical protein